MYPHKTEKTKRQDGNGETCEPISSRSLYFDDKDDRFDLSGQRKIGVFLVFSLYTLAWLVVCVFSLSLHEFLKSHNQNKM